MLCVRLSWFLSAYVSKFNRSVSYLIRQYLSPQVRPSREQPFPASDRRLHHRLLKEADWSDAQMLQQLAISILRSHQQRRHTKQHALELSRIWQPMHNVNVFQLNYVRRNTNLQLTCSVLKVKGQIFPVLVKLYNQRRHNTM